MQAYNKQFLSKKRFSSTSKKYPEEIARFDDFFVRDANELLDIFKYCEQNNVYITFYFRGDYFDTSKKSSEEILDQLKKTTEKLDKTKLEKANEKIDYYIKQGKENISLTHGYMTEKDFIKENDWIAMVKDRVNSPTYGEEISKALDIKKALDGGASNEEIKKMLRDCKVPLIVVNASKEILCRFFDKDEIEFVRFLNKNINPNVLKAINDIETNEIKKDQNKTNDIFNFNK